MKTYLKCVDVGWHSLTNGKVYTSLNFESKGVFAHVTNDKGDVVDYRKDRFVVVDKPVDNLWDKLTEELEKPRGEIKGVFYGSLFSNKNLLELAKECKWEYSTLMQFTHTVNEYLQGEI